MKEKRYYSYYLTRTPVPVRRLKSRKGNKSRILALIMRRTPPFLRAYRDPEMEERHPMSPGSRP